MICDNCMNNPKNNPYASGFCNCALPAMELGDGWFQGGRTQTEKTFTTSNFITGGKKMTLASELINSMEELRNLLEQPLEDKNPEDTEQEDESMLCPWNGFRRCVEKRCPFWSLYGCRRIKNGKDICDE